MAEIGGIALRTIWDVEADRNYDIGIGVARRDSMKAHHQGGTGLIALWTLAGQGRVYLDPDGVIEVATDTLLLTDWDHIQRYHCQADRWRFRWFEFTLTGPSELPLHELMHISAEDDDEQRFEELRRALRREDVSQWRLAAAEFAWMLHRWLSHHERRRLDSPWRRAVLDVIEQMHEKLGSGWTVREMARAAHMSERRFRTAFHNVTGQPPKKFYDGLRLATASEHLRLGMSSVGEIADRLGFSSPFHFSRAFRKRFGFPPSTIARENIRRSARTDGGDRH